MNFTKICATLGALVATATISMSQPAFADDHTPPAGRDHTQVIPSFTCDPATGTQTITWEIRNFTQLTAMKISEWITTPDASTPASAEVPATGKGGSFTSTTATATVTANTKVESAHIVADWQLSKRQDVQNVEAQVPECIKTVIPGLTAGSVTPPECKVPTFNVNLATGEGTKSTEVQVDIDATVIQTVKMAPNSTATVSVPTPTKHIVLQILQDGKLVKEIPIDAPTCPTVTPPTTTPSPTVTTPVTNVTPHKPACQTTTTTSKLPCELALTGSSTLPLAILGFGAVACGGFFVLFGRRRRVMS